MTEPPFSGRSSVQWDGGTPTYEASRQFVKYGPMIVRVCPGCNVPRKTRRSSATAWIHVGESVADTSTRVIAGHTPLPPDHVPFYRHRSER